MNNRHSRRAVWACGLSGCLLIASGCAGGRTYATPQEAMQAVADTAGTLNREKLDEIFGSGATEVLWSGDPVADREDGARVRAMILERVQVTEEGEDWATVVIGDEQWPFPIPLVHSSKGWRFDLAEGKEELNNRRVGRNELLTIATLHAYVDAQREYASASRDGTAPAYAQKLMSTEGKHDGLYWPTADGEPESPMGPLLSEAAAEGYHRSEAGPVPYHGYYYRILTGQGASAFRGGGEKSYLDAQGRLTGGFAAVAWPATYGNSGVMTFIVNQVGIIFQKDLGPKTGETVPPVTLFDPDLTWEPVADQ